MHRFGNNACTVSVKTWRATSLRLNFCNVTTVRPVVRHSHTTGCDTHTRPSATLTHDRVRHPHTTECDTHTRPSATLTHDRVRLSCSAGAGLQPVPQPLFSAVPRTSAGTHGLQIRASGVGSKISNPNSHFNPVRGSFSTNSSSFKMILQSDVNHKLS
jgi:hypothetical protein